MTLNEILPSLKRLDRFEKMRVVQILIDEIVSEEATYFESGKQYEIWSPYESHSAAAVLEAMLEEKQQNV